MKAVYLTRHAGPECLITGELPIPVPQKNEVLVRIHATAATPTEFQWYPTFNTRAGTPRPFPVVPSHELSGVIAAIGPDVSADTKIGDAVYGLNDWFVNGALAEYCIAPAAALAAKPASLTHAQAAVVPISALTAWQALVTGGKIQRGQRVLIHGGSGGVGVFAVQLARLRGARVIATSSSANLDFVRSLGADEVIDYRTTRFENVVRDVDFVLDSVGGETLARSWSVLRTGGTLVTIAAQSPAAGNARDRDAFMLVEPNRAQLTEIAQWIDAGKLRVFVEEEYPLTEAIAGYARAQKGGMHGKVAFQIDG
jgi:NADPH:quinone reductase-like Zn-dependent oxidoreductase